MAAVRVEVASLRLQLAWKRYDPDQPRVPAGSSDGGQWTDGDGGLGDGPWGARWLDQEPELRPTPATLDGRENRYKISIYAEAARGGHTIRRHVNKSDRELVQRLEEERAEHEGKIVFRFRNGTFFSMEEARELTERTLHENQLIVEEVRSGRRMAARISHRFGFVTGREVLIKDLYDKPSFRPTYAVEVRIFYDKRSPNNFTVVTSFPFNQDHHDENRR
jgi:hypothetical protein